MNSVIHRADLSTLWLLGDPVHHSLSPLIQNTALKALNQNLLYVASAVKADHFVEVVETLPKIGALGANITVPHKLAAHKVSEKLGSNAELMGAVNTLRFHKGVVEGYNTDGPGWWNALGDECPGSWRKNVLVIGAGGAARAICHTALGHGTENLWILNRTSGKANTLKQELCIHYPQAKIEIGELAQFEQLLSQVGLVVQTTSVGLDRESSPVRLPESWPTSCFFSELIYGPRTPLMKRVEELGGRFQDGLGMLCGQAALSLAIWLDKPVENIPLHLMLDTARQHLAKSD